MKILIEVFGVTGIICMIMSGGIGQMYHKLKKQSGFEMAQTHSNIVIYRNSGFYQLLDILLHISIFVIIALCWYLFNWKLFLFSILCFGIGNVFFNLFREFIFAFRQLFEHILVYFMWLKPLFIAYLYYKLLSN